MSGEMCSECDGYEVVIVDGEEVHCATCSLRAEMERLHGIVDLGQQLLRESAEANSRLKAEIERLRAAGDALVGALENNLMATAVVLVNQWKEARRG